MHISVHHCFRGRVAPAHGVERRAAVHQLLAAAGLLPQQAVRRGPHGGPRLCDERRNAAVLLKAAAQAAVARFTVHIDDKVAQLARGPVAARDDAAVFNDAAAYARAQRHHHHTGAAPANARPVFAPGRRIGVVVHIDGQAQTGAQHRAQRHIIEFQIVGIFHYARIFVHTAGRAHADPRHLLQRRLRRLRQTAAQRGDAVRNFIRRARHAGFDALCVHQTAVQRGDAPRDVGAAQVNADTVFHLPFSSSVNNGAQNSTFCAHRIWLICPPRHA